MPMPAKVRQKNWKRLASLSAAGAGALGVVAGAADAGTINTFTFPANTVVTPDGRREAVSDVDLGWLFSVVARNNGGGTYQRWKVYLSGQSGMFRTFSTAEGRTFLNLAVQGAKWGASGRTASTYYPVIASRIFSSYDGTYQAAFGNTGPEPKFVLFKFQNSTSSSYNYGWLKLSVDVSETTGPNVTLYSWAYDSSGQLIAAGDEGQVPEPSTAALAGFGALAFGAVGLRRWRAARKNAA